MSADERRALYEAVTWELMQWAERGVPRGGTKQFAFGMECVEGGPMWTARLLQTHPGGGRKRDIEIRSPGAPDLILRTARTIASVWDGEDDDD